MILDRKESLKFLARMKETNDSILENYWDYLFFSYRANLPLKGNFRSDLDKLHHAVNVIVKSKLNEKKVKPKRIVCVGDMTKGYKHCKGCGKLFKLTKEHKFYCSNDCRIDYLVQDDNEELY